MSSLKIYSPETVQKMGEPLLGFAKNGIISVYKQAAEKCDLKDGDKIIFAEDEQGNFVFRKTDKKESGFAVENKKTGKYESLIVRCGAFCKIILKSLRADSAVKALVGGTVELDGKEWHSLITSINKKP